MLVVTLRSIYKFTLAFTKSSCKHPSLPNWERNFWKQNMDNLLATDSAIGGKGEKLKLAQATTELALVERWDGGCELLPSGAFGQEPI